MYIKDEQGNSVIIVIYSVTRFTKQPLLLMFLVVVRGKEDFGGVFYTCSYVLQTSYNVGDFAHNSSAGTSWANWLLPNQADLEE